MNRAVLSLLLLAGFLVACRNNNNSASLPAPAQLAPDVKKSFATAKPELKAAADQVADSIQSKDFGKAFLQTQVLVDSKELTDEQRRAANSAGASVWQEVLKAAANGDAQAKELVKAYKESR